MYVRNEMYWKSYFYSEAKKANTHISTSYLLLYSTKPHFLNPL